MAVTALAVSLVVQHDDGSVSSVVYPLTGPQYQQLQQQLTDQVGGPLYHRHIPTEQIREWGPKVARLGVVV